MSIKVNVDIDDILETLDNDDLISELRQRGVKLYYTIPELLRSSEELNILVLELCSQDAFITSAKQIVWELDTSKVELFLDIIKNSHHNIKG